MTDDKLTTKQFCQHTGTGKIFVVEMTLSHIVVGSYGPLPADDLKPPDNYDCTNELNAWLETQKDMFIMIWKVPCCLPMPQRLLRNITAPRPRSKSVVQTDDRKSSKAHSTGLEKAIYMKKTSRLKCNYFSSGSQVHSAVGLPQPEQTSSLMGSSLGVHPHDSHIFSPFKSTSKLIW